MAGPTLRLLARALGTSLANDLRQVPATNVIFRHAHSMDELPMSDAKAHAESRPALMEILKIVAPDVILIVSTSAYRLFSREDVTQLQEDTGTITSPNGTHNAVIFKTASGYVPALQKHVRLIMTGYPSKFAGRPEWELVEQRCEEEFKHQGLNPMVQQKWRTQLTALPDHHDA